MDESKKLRRVNWLLRDKYPYFLKDPKKYLPVIQKDIERLEAGEPLAYVIGWVDFLGAKIDLSYKPLIPRVETEFWVERAIRQIKSESTCPYRYPKRCGRADLSEYPEYKGKQKGFTLHASRFRMLDLCSGSGCIGLAILKHLPESRVTFVDNKPNCLRQIRKNLKLNKISLARYKIIRSNVLKNVRTLFDYVFTNPPYIPAGRKLPDSVKKFEPKEALFAGKGGLAILRQILKEVPRHLRPGGKIYFEFDSGQKKRIEILFKNLPYAEHELRKDQYGEWRWGCARTAAK
ncbi:MAG: peptide chain release factor N(5)-glutamine methyltransferase [Candidatus Liptonbacteria bacterium]